MTDWGGVTGLPTVITGVDVEKAVTDLLKSRLPVYLDRLGYPAIRGWLGLVSFDKFPEDQLPLIIVHCSGTSAPPTKTGRGPFNVKWAVGIAVIISARDQESSNKLAKEYGSLVRAIVVQQPGLNGFAVGSQWTEESYNELPIIDRRTWASCEIFLEVEVANVVDARELPPIPDGPIPTPSPYDVDEVSVDVIPQEVSH